MCSSYSHLRIFRTVREPPIEARTVVVNKLLYKLNQCISQTAIFGVVTVSVTASNLSKLLEIMRSHWIVEVGAVMVEAVLIDRYGRMGRNPCLSLSH